MPALEMASNCIYRMGSEKYILPVVLVSDKTFVYQLRFRRKCERNLAGAKPVISKQEKHVKKLRWLALERSDNDTTQ